MFSAGGSFRGSRGASFAQMLMKSLPPTSESRELNKEQCSFNVDQEHDSVRQGTKSSKPGHFEKPKSSPKVLVEKYKKGETNAVSLLHQLAQVLQFHLEIKETVTTGNLPGFYFAFAVEIDGVQHKTGMGVTKKEARLNAAKAALEDFLPSLGCLKSDLPQTSDVPPPLPVKEEAAISDRIPSRAFYERKSSVNLQIPHAVKDQLSKLLNNHPEFSSCGETTAAFIVKTSVTRLAALCCFGNLSFYWKKKKSTTSGGAVGVLNGPCDVNAVEPQQKGNNTRLRGCEDIKGHETATVQKHPTPIGKFCSEIKHLVNNNNNFTKIKSPVGKSSNLLSMP